MNKQIEKMLNEQMNFEFYSAYIYKAMAAYCDSIDLPGFANWLKVQVQEEMFHSEKFYNFLIGRRGRPFFTKVDEPAKDWASVKAVFEDAFKHEQLVTERINKLMTAAVEAHDHATRSFLDWFVDEQVEEEANVDAVIKQLERIKESPEGLFFLDKEMAARTFTPPVAAAG